MDITVVRNHIKNKEPDSFYIFTGDEWAIQQIYVQKLSQCKNYQVMRVDTVSEVFAKLKNKSILSRPVCYVIRDDNEFVKNETAWRKVEEALEDNILILQLTHIDKRSKFYKQYKDKIVVFEKLSDDMLTKYIQREIELSNRSCKYLISICESDYGRILLEIDKIKQYTIDSYDKALETLVKEGAIYQPPKDVMFDWVDTVIKHKVVEAFELYKECELKGVSPLVMLSVLYTNAKQVLQVQDCMRENVNIEKSTGLTNYQVNMVKQKCGHYGIGDLVYMIKQIRNTEVGIKTGKIEDKTAIPLLMLNIL